MTPRLLALALVAALALSVLGGAQAVAQDNGRLDGRVVNGTAGGPTPADATVTVHIIRDRSKVGERVVQADQEGRFAVDGLATGANTIYFPIVDYGGAIYYPDQPVLLDDQPAKTTEITVFEPTRSSEGLAFERSNMLIMSVSPTFMTVMEMGAVVNRTDRAFVGDDQGRTLRLVLPAGATNVSPQTGLPPDALEALPDGFALTDPIKPGRRELAFSYQLPFDAATLDVMRTQALPIETFTLYVPDNGLNVVSSGLALQGTAELGGQRFQQFVAQGVPPDGELAFRLTGLPAQFSLKLRELGFLVAGVGTVGLGVVLAIALRRRPAHAPGPVTATSASDRDGERARLVQALADLDERFAAGQIDEEEYRAERDRDKRRLVALLASSPPS
ncbi:MAG: hypothetical protein M3O34_05955 [Chloroflexota bacterium]|nr:hypothetical protein [Chloroflexota bacterium]